MDKGISKFFQSVSRENEDTVYSQPENPQLPRAHEEVRREVPAEHSFTDGKPVSNEAKEKSSKPYASETPENPKTMKSTRPSAHADAIKPDINCRP